MAGAGVDPAGLVAIGVDGMISGVLGVDGAGTMTSPYTTIADRRFRTHTDDLLEASRPEIIATTGTSEPAMGPKIAWIRAARPAEAARTTHWLTLSAYVASALCEVRPGPYIDSSQLWATGLADPVARVWSERLCELFGVAMGSLPEIVDPVSVVGELDHHLAREVGAPAGVRIIAGLGDQTAGFAALGRPDGTRVLDVAGTYPNLVGTSRVFAPDVGGLDVHILPSVTPGWWHPATFVIGGGSTIDWAARLLSGSSRDGDWRRALEARAEAVEPGSAGVRFIPDLASPTGGSWTGVRWEHDEGHLFRAVLEGVTFELARGWVRLREIDPMHGVDRMVTYGGGRASVLWNDIKRHTLGLPQQFPDEADLSAIGVAQLAGTAVGASGPDDLVHYTDGEPLNDEMVDRYRHLFAAHLAQHSEKAGACSE